MMLHPLSVLKKLSVFLLLHAISITTAAQVFNSSVSSATGGTGRAAVEASDAAFLNPATLVHLRGHFFYTSFADGEFAVHLIDNSEDSFLPGALGYVQRTRDVSQGELREQNLSLSLAEFVRDKITFGITGHYREQKLPSISYQQPNADLGILYTPKSNIGWALVAYNVFGEQRDIPENFRMKTSVVGGFNYIAKSTVRFRVDASSDSIFMGGIETYLNRFLITRVGYSADTGDDRGLLTGGVGFSSPRFVINYGYQGNVKSSGDYRHSVDLEIPF